MIICPYCNSTFESKDEITRHIDESHILNSWLWGSYQLHRIRPTMN